MSDPAAALSRKTAGMTLPEEQSARQEPGLLSQSGIALDGTHSTRPVGKAFVSQGADTAAASDPPMIDYAVGARIFDTQGRSYLDLCMGYGALLLGHGAAVVKEALHKQLDRGWMYGYAHTSQGELAELIRTAAPANEHVSLCNSESDAALLALRAARAVTRRDRIAVFAQARHGLHDFALVTETHHPAKAANDSTIRRKAHIGAGIPAIVSEAVIVLPYGDMTAIDWIRSYAGHLAAVIAEPFPSQAPSLEHGAWLHQVQAACRSTGTVFILDEASSGFRLGYGGAQALFSLSPDLVTYGAVMGGGLSIGAVAGRAEVMAPFASTDPNKRIFSGTTHSGNPLSVAAAVAVLNILYAHGDEVYPHLNDAAAMLARNFNDAAAALQADARMMHAGSMFKINFGDKELGNKEFGGKSARERAFYQHLLARNVLVHASTRCFLSTAHTVADIQELSAAMTDSLHACA